MIGEERRTYFKWGLPYKMENIQWETDIQRRVDKKNEDIHIYKGGQTYKG